MSPFVHYEIARARQQEIVSHATNSHRSRAARTTADRHHTVKHRLVQAVAALGVCVAAGTAVTVSDAHSNTAARRPSLGTAGRARDPRVRGQGLRADVMHRRWDADAELQHRPVGDSQVVAAALPSARGELEGGGWKRGREIARLSRCARDRRIPRGEQDWRLGRLY